MVKIKHLVLKGVSLKALEGADVRVSISVETDCDEMEASRIMQELLPYAKKGVSITVQSEQTELPFQKAV